VKDNPKLIDIRYRCEDSEGSSLRVLGWLKTEGDPVRENEPLIEIETDKVTVEIASLATGLLCTIVKREQDDIAPGETLGQVEVSQLSLPCCHRRSAFNSR
jgi:2-oxoglutarate dehydrogenase E2 component (dihydrolipoamide succinyltransferase)